MRLSSKTPVVSKGRGGPTTVLVIGIILVLSIFNLQGSTKNIKVVLGFTSYAETKQNETLSDSRMAAISIGIEDLPETELKARKFWTLFSRSNYHLDMGVPVMGQDAKLLNFARAYGDAIREFNGKVNKPQPIEFRLLVTRYPSDDSTPKFRQTLAKAVSLDEQSVIFLPTNETSFHRAHAINLLHAGAIDDEKAAVAIMDVDMWVGPRFLFNALKEVTTEAVYFPIVYSEFRPSTVLVVEKILGPQSRYSEHRGLWRDFGFGMYAMSGSTAKSFLMDEGFKGWGGEDNNFHQRAEARFSVIRTKEYDLIHRWHAKYCDLGSFVQGKMLDRCIGSRNAMEGSSFGNFLLSLRETEASHFEKLVQASKGNEGLELAEIEALAEQEYEPGRSPKNATVAATASVRGQQAHGILIGVTASRATFPTRVAELMSTWASNLPNGVFVRIFVGGPVDETAPYASGSHDDIGDLAKQAGIADNSTIVVMKGIRDDEHPSVEKAAAVLKYMDKAILSLKNQTKEYRRIDWVFDVDDDTYVNVEALQEFLVKPNSQRQTYVGRNGHFLRVISLAVEQKETAIRRPKHPISINGTSSSMKDN